MPTRKKKKKDFILLKNYQIDTSKLKAGMTLRYPELCKLIGVPAKQGSGKNAQLSDTLKEHSFKRYFDYEKVGRGLYEITEIYDKPLPVSDGRRYGNNRKYASQVTNIIRQLQNEIQGEPFTRIKLWQKCGLVNYNFYRTSSFNMIPKEHDGERRLTPIEVAIFFERCTEKVNSILISALNNMESLNIITWKIAEMVSDDSGRERIATCEESDIIRKLEQEILSEFGFFTIFQLYSHFKSKEYYNRISEITEEKYNWTLDRKLISITYNGQCNEPYDANGSIHSYIVDVNTKVMKYLSSQSYKIYEDKTNVLKNISLEQFVSGQEMLINKYVKRI